MLSRVAIVAGTGSQDAESLLARSPQHDLFKIQALPADDAQMGFRLGKFDLVIEPDGKGDSSIATIPRARKACSPNPKSTTRCKPPPAAKMSSPRSA